MNLEDIERLEQKLSEKFPFGIPRRHISEASGGLIQTASMANLDCTGKGIPDRFKSQRQVVYPVTSFVKFMTSRFTYNV